MFQKFAGILALCVLLGCQTTKGPATNQNTGAFEDIKIYDAHLSEDGAAVFFTADAGAEGVGLYRYGVSSQGLERLDIAIEYSIHTAFVVEDQRRVVLKLECGSVPGCKQRLERAGASTVLAVYDLEKGELGPPHYIDTRFQSVAFARDNASPSRVVFSVFGVVRAIDVRTSDVEVLFPNTKSRYWMPGISDLATLPSGDVVFTSSPFVIDDIEFMGQRADALSFNMPGYRERARQASSSVDGLSKAGPYYRLRRDGAVEPYRKKSLSRHRYFDIVPTTQEIIAYADKANLSGRYPIAKAAQGGSFEKISIGGNSAGPVSVSRDGTRAVAKAWSDDRGQWEVMLVDVESGRAETLPLHPMVHDLCCVGPQS